MFKKMKIGTRLGVAFGLVTLLAGTLGLVSFKTLNVVDSTWTDFSSISLQKREFASQANVKLGDAVHHFKNFLIRGQDYGTKFEADLVAIDAAMTLYASKPISAGEQSFLDRISHGLEAYRVAMRKVVTMKATDASIQVIDRSISGADKEIGAALAGLTEICRESTM